MQPSNLTAIHYETTLECSERRSVGDFLFLLLVQNKSGLCMGFYWPMLVTP